MLAKHHRTAEAVVRAAIIVVAGLLFLPPGSASASPQALRGNALLQMCRTPQSGTCAAYFVGFISGAMMSDAERADGRPICLSGVSANRLRRAFTGFAKQHRDLMSRHADSLVATAAAQSFRCKHTEVRH